MSGVWLPLAFVASAIGGAAAMSAEAPPAGQPPVVFIFCGSPGDADRHESFTERLAAWMEWFVQRAGVPVADVRIWYGPAAEGYAGEATRANVEQACATIVKLTRAGRPVWLLIAGHANDAPGDVRFNVPGADFCGRELAAWLAGAAEGEGAASLTVILATACSGRAVRHLSAPGRAIMAAANAVEPADEPVFGDMLLGVLADPGTDADANGAVSLTEIFRALRAAVQARYDEGDFLLAEHACLDGDGDGRATQRPAESDAAAAAAPAHSLRLEPPESRLLIRAPSVSPSRSSAHAPAVDGLPVADPTPSPTITRPELRPPCRMPSQLSSPTA